MGQAYDLMVIGGSALLALGFVSRPTRDVDLVALVDDGSLAPVDPLPAPLAEASSSAKPSGRPSWSIPDYGPNLSVRFASRYDQIHFKLYALADRGPGKHGADLRALEPTRDELIAAARWSRTHDPSEPP